MFPHLPGIYNPTNPEYLEANRRGEINHDQAALLGPDGSKFFKKFQRGSKLNGIIILIILAFFLGIQAVGIELSTPMVLGAFGLLLVVLAVQAGRRWASSHKRASRLEKDLRRGVVHDAVGILHFGKDTYTVVVSGRPLRLPQGSKEGLSPGVSYRFYYLPESGVVLSAEALDDEPAERAVEGMTATLAEANGFHLASLSANQRGELSREQYPLLYRGLISPLIFILVPGGFLVYQLSRAGIFNGISLAGNFTNLKGMSTSLLVIGGILAALMIWGLVLLVQAVMDIAGGQVASVEDIGYRQVKTSTDDDGSKTTQLYYQVGGIKFRVQKRGFNAFEDGRNYRAYYTPRRKVLVNIEAVG